MSYHQQGGPEGGRRQGPPYPIMGANGGAGGRAPAAGVYGIPQYGQEGYGGPPPSPVVSGGWDRGYVSALDDTYMRQDPGLPLGTGTPGITSGASGSGDTGYLVSGGNANAMAAPLQSYYPPSLYGVPTSVYPFQQPAGFPGPYGGGGAAGAGAAGNSAGAGSTGGANFYGQTGYARSTNPGQPIQTTTNLQGPDGCNLFVFHIPNTMTNEALFRLFSKFGNVISARIMVEKATGRSRGFGFVSYDNRDSAEKAISQMNGYQIEHKRLKVQHKKDKERDRYNVAAPSPTQRMMPGGPTTGSAGVPSRVQQPPHNFRQTLLPPQHSSAALRHHTVGEDKPPPPSPAAEAGAGGVSQAFTVSPTEEELPEHGEPSSTEVGIDGSVDPSFGSSASRGGGGEKYARNNDHPHLAYIYRGRGPTRDDETVPGAYPSAGGADSKANVGEEEPPEQAADGSAYRARDDGANYLTAHGGAATSAGVGGSNRPRPASPDPKTGVARPRSASPSSAAATAAAAVAVAAAAALPHQSLEHAMQTKLTLGSAPSPPASAQPS